NPPTGGPTGPPSPAASPLRRLVTAVVVVLLVALPAGYLVLSAHQSRDSGKDKQQIASATSLVWDWPSRVTRRIYEVPIPSRSTYVAYFETNSWRESSLYVQFRTSPERLDDFLATLGLTRSDLTPGRSISDARADVVGWDLRSAGRSFASTTVDLPEHRPEVAVTVDLTRPERPQVYVVSTARF
ncbi:hypothetical protein H3146_24225, partial [Streptomyces sp. OF3]